MELKVVLIGQGGVIITGVPVYNDRNLRATCKGEMVFLQHLEEGGLSRPKQCYQSPILCGYNSRLVLALLFNKMSICTLSVCSREG